MTGAEEILITPVKGVYISRMIKIAADTAKPARPNVTKIVAFGGEKRPKPTKMITSQEVSTTSRGMGTELCWDLRYMSH